MNQILLMKNLFVIWFQHAIKWCYKRFACMYCMYVLQLKFNKFYMDTMCVAWCKVMRRVYKLNCRNTVIQKNGTLYNFPVNTHNEYIVKEVFTYCLLHNNSTLGENLRWINITYHTNSYKIQPKIVQDEKKTRY